MSIQIDKKLEKEYIEKIQKKADVIMSFFVIGFFIFGVAFAPMYQTWAFGLGIGGINLLLFFIARFLIKNLFISRLIISLILSIYMLQFIGQSHGMAEFHFFFFTNIALLIIYQDWRIMIPYTVFAIGHHSIFFYFQIIGIGGLGTYFINYTDVTIYTLFFHFGLAILMAVICAWWAIEFRNRSIVSFTAQRKLSEQVLNLEGNMNLALKISSGDFDTNFIPKDITGEYLLGIQNNLIKSVEKDNLEAFKTAGLLSISKILRDYFDLKELAKHLLQDILRILNAQQGAVFLVNNKVEKPYLYPLIHQSYSTEQKAKSKILLGEGILGEVVKNKEVFYLENVPIDYGMIRTGLGETPVRNILIVPLTFNEETIGVIEINSLYKIETHKIDFLKTVSENIVSTILALQSVEENKKLLQESQALANELQTREEELMAQEEELKQNMEEMQTIQEELQRKQAQLEAENAALNSSKILRIEFSTDGYARNANQAFYDLFEYSEQELYNEPHTTLLSKEYANSEEYKNFWEDLRAGHKKGGEIKRITKSGKEVILNAVYAPIFDKNNKVIAVIKFALDITELKELLQNAEIQNENLLTLKEDLEHKQAQLESEAAALNNSSILRIEFTNDGFIKTANNSFYEVFEYSEQELKDKNHSHLVSEQYQNSKEYKQFWGNLRAGKRISGDMIRTTKSGKEIILNAVYAPILNRKNEVEGVLKFAFDITDTILLKNNLEEEVKENAKLLLEAQSFNSELQIREEELMAQQEELRQNVEEMQSIQEDLQYKQAQLEAEAAALNNSSILRIEFTNDGFVKTANNSFYEVFGYSETELKDRNHSHLVPEQYRNSKEYKQFWEDLRAGKCISGDMKRITKSGKEITLNAVYAPILNRKNEVDGVLKFAFEISK